MERDEVKAGAIVQISPHVSGGIRGFGGCLMVVTEVKSWGVQGYVKNAGTEGVHPYRAEWRDVQATGGTMQWHFIGDGTDPVKP